MAYDPRTDGNSPKYQPAGIGKPGDNRGMGQFITDELPGMIRTRTLAELQELVAGLKTNYQAIGITREQAQQAVTMVEQRIAQAPGSARPPAGPQPVADTQGYGLRTTDVGAAPEAAPLTSTAPTRAAIPEAPAEPIEGVGQTSSEQYRKFQVDQIQKRHAGDVATQTAPDFAGAGQTSSEQYRKSQVDQIRKRHAGDVSEGEGALPTDTLPPPRAKPRPGKGKPQDYDGMTVKDFMEQGDVLHIAINGKGLRNDGGKFVPVGR